MTEYSLSLEQFLDRFAAGFDQFNRQLARRAYVLAEALHRTQTRDEGTPYFNHPLSVTRTVVEELGYNGPTIVCGALLHDVVEDSDITVEDLNIMFNPEIAETVRLLTKTRGIGLGEYLAAIERLSPNMALPIKLSDRLDNLRGLHLSHKTEKRVKYLHEMEEHYLPLAARHNGYVHEQMSLILSGLSGSSEPTAAAANRGLSSRANKTVF